MLLSTKYVANTKNGLAKLSYLTISMQKLRTLSENYYLSYDFENALKYDTVFLKKYIAYCTIRTVKEHMAAFTYASLITNAVSSAIEFYRTMSEIIKTYIISLDKISLIANEIKKQMEILNGNLSKYAGEDAYKEPAQYMEPHDFFYGLINNRPLGIENKEDALIYDLLYIYNYGYADDFIRYYKDYSSMIINNKQIHLRAAKIFNYANNRTETCQALYKYVQNGCPNTSNHIPMTLFSFYSLYPLYSFDLFEKLFNN